MTTDNNQHPDDGAIEAAIDKLLGSASQRESQRDKNDAKVEAMIAGGTITITLPLAGVVAAGTILQVGINALTTALKDALREGGEITSVEAIRMVRLVAEAQVISAQLLQAVSTATAQIAEERGEHEIARDYAAVGATIAEKMGEAKYHVTFPVPK